MEECFIVSVCGHKFCREGAREMALAAIRSGEFPVLCAVCKARSEPPCEACESRRSQAASIEAAGGPEASTLPADWCCNLDGDLPFLLTLEEEEEYFSRSVRSASLKVKDLVPCPVPDCTGLAVAGGTDMSPRLVCNVCQHEWCGCCKIAWHLGKTCDDVERERGEAVAEKGMAQYRKSTRVVTCPTCGMGITKVDGCNRVRCGSCHKDMCWLCGAALTGSNPYDHFKMSGKCKGGTYRAL
eukprot:jgi/Botrbrau1/11732/Bobra.0195s0059.1